MTTPAIRFLQEESARLKKENQAHQEQIQALHRYIEVLAELYWAAQSMASTIDPLKAFDHCLESVIDVVGCKDGSLLCFDPDTDELVFTVVHGELRQQLPGHRIPSDTGVAGWVLENGQPVIVNNPRQDWRFSLTVDEEFAFLTRSILCEPVILEDKTFGVVELVNKDPHGFTEADEILLSILSHIAALTLQA